MPVINAGDTAWMLVSTAMVMFMTPGLAFFYGGMVRRKNTLSTIMMSFMTLGVIGVAWVLFGYSLAFGTGGGGFIGGFNYLFLNNVGQDPSPVYASTVPHLTFAAYQMMFAIITVALITGAVVERVKFSAMVVFALVWFVLVYTPVAHWVWSTDGWLLKLGALDFAGGTVVHITAGVSAFSLAWLLGPRKDFSDGTPMAPANVPFVVIGASILWFGWFGFNGGSALSSGGLASSAFITTNIAAAAAALTWMLISWFYHRPTLTGIATGAVAGLVAITPAAGFVSPILAIPIGIGVSVICFYVMRLRSRSKTDDSLDVFACHGMGGSWGAIATGIFASTAVNTAGADGLIHGGWALIGKQLLAVAVVWVFAFGMTWIIGKIIDKTMGLRVSTTEESLGLDISQHGETAYGN
ncbi:MAG TPA: ammonium transporter [Dehalococcoidales bacterium]|nr:ammonium transporter [Dehalococcoidales bacterium]